MCVQRGGRRDICHVCADNLGGQKRASDLLELGLQVVVQTERGSSGRASSVLKHGTNSPVSWFIFTF